MESYIAAGSIHLTNEDIRAIDEAGYKAAEIQERKAKIMKGIKLAAAGGLFLLAAYRMVRLG
jgi:hypothetical protein